MTSRTANMQLLALLPLIAMLLAFCTGPTQGRELLQNENGAKKENGSKRGPCLSECSDFITIGDYKVEGEAKLFSDQGGTLGHMSVVIDGYKGESVAHVHNDTCSVENGGPHWQKVVGGPVDITNEFWYNLESFKIEESFYLASEFNWDVKVPPPGVGGGNAVVVHDAEGDRLACCDLVAC